LPCTPSLELGSDYYTSAGMHFEPTVPVDGGGRDIVSFEAQYSESNVPSGHPVSPGATTITLDGIYFNFNVGDNPLTVSVYDGIVRGKDTGTVHVAAELPAGYTIVENSQYGGAGYYIQDGKLSVTRGRMTLSDNKTLPAVNVYTQAEFLLAAPQLTLTNMTADEVRAALAKAYRGATKWTGKGGISSPLAAADPSGRTLGYTIIGDTIVICNAIAGDVDLDGAVDADDYFAIDQGYSSRGSNYFEGDLDFNARVDADDYFLLDSAYHRANSTVSGQPASAGGSELPTTSTFPSSNAADRNLDDLFA
jgi:hypothetical protein